MIIMTKPTKWNENQPKNSSVSPSIMTVEFFTPAGKRYDFEQMRIDDTSFFVTFTNESGNKIILRFWENLQSKKDFPLDPESEKHYVEVCLPEMKKKGLI
jgi:hypothetical protein